MPSGTDDAKRGGTPAGGSVSGPFGLQVEGTSSLSEGRWPSGINFKFVFGTVAVLTALYGSATWWHGVQLTRLADRFKSSAAEAAAEGDTRREIRMLRAYLRALPDDIALRVRLIDRLCETADGPAEKVQLYNLCEQLLRRDAENIDVRIRLVEILLDAGKPASASGHLDYIEATGDVGVDVWRLRARSAEGLGDTPAAIVALERVVEALPGAIDDYLAIVHLYDTRLTRRDDAIAVLNEMVAKNRGSSRAYFERSKYLRHIGRWDRASYDLREAFRLAPTDPDILVAVGGAIEESALAAEIFERGEVRRRLREAIAGVLDDGGAARAVEVAPLIATAVTFDVVSGRYDAAGRLIEQALTRFPDSVFLRVSAAEYRLAAGDREGAERELAELTELGAPTALLSYLKARFHVVDGDWLTACRLLRAAEFEADNDSHRVKIGTALAACAREMGDRHGEIVALRRVLDAGGEMASARAAMAKALAATGRRREAWRQWGRPSVDPDALLAMARLGVSIVAEEAGIDKSRKAVTAREIESLIAQAAARGATPQSVTELRARLELAVGRNDEALELLGDPSAGGPFSSGLVLARIDALLSLGRREEAAKALRALEKLNRDHPSSIRFASIVSAWIGFGIEIARPHILRLVAERPSVGDSTGRRAGMSLVDVLVKLGEFAPAAEIAEELVDAWPRHAGCWSRYVAVSAARGAGDDVERGIDRLKSIEGSGGVLWRLASAARAIRSLRSGGDGDATEIRASLESVRKTAGLPEAYRLAGELSLVQGDESAAVREFRAAFDGGDMRRHTVGRLVELLVERRRYEQAADVIRRADAGRRGGLDASLERLAAVVAIGAGESDAAVDYAIAAVTRSGDDGPEAMLFLGEIHRRAGRYSEAIDYFRGCVSSESSRPEGWVGLVETYVAAGNREAAVETAREARSRLGHDLPAETVAICFARAGDNATATEILTEAAEAPDAAASLKLRYARSLIDEGRRADAELVLSDLADDGLGQDDERVRRRLLGGLQLRKPSPVAARRGLELLARNLDDGKTSADLRAFATAAINTGDRVAIREATLMFRELARRQGALDRDDEEAFVRLLVAAGEWEEAWNRLRTMLVGEAIPHSQYEFAAATALARGVVDPIVGDWVDKFAELRPGTLTALSLRVQWLSAEGRIGDVVSLLSDGFDRGCRDYPAGSELSRRLATLSELLAARSARMGRTDDAARILDAAEMRLVDMFDDDKAQGPALASFLARRGDCVRASAVSVAAAEAADPTAALTALYEVLRLGRDLLPDSERDAVSAAATEVLGRASGSGRAFLLAGHIANLSGRYAKAVERYRAALELDPGETDAANELAFLLAVSRIDVAEATVIIEDTLVRTGRVPTLLDTASVVASVAGDHAAAVERATAAVDAEPDPVRLYHLAVAHRASGEPLAAVDSFRRAVGTGLTAERLHPLERPGHADFVEWLRLLR